MISVAGIVHAGRLIVTDRLDLDSFLFADKPFATPDDSRLPLLLGVRQLEVVS